MNGATRFALTIVFAIPIALVVLGGPILFGSLAQIPRDRRSAAAYASDPSCTAGFSAASSTGACTIVDAHVENADGGTPSGTNLRNEPVRLPSFTLRLADGSQANAEIHDRAFFNAVYPGDDVRVQLFGGNVTAIAAHGLEAQTAGNPSRRASNDRALPLVGGIMVATGVVLLVAIATFLRRMRAAARAGISGPSTQQ